MAKFIYDHPKSGSLEHRELRIQGNQPIQTAESEGPFQTFKPLAVPFTGARSCPNADCIFAHQAVTGQEPCTKCKFLVLADYYIKAGEEEKEASALGFDDVQVAIERLES